jgi:hypothetical protein
VKAAFTDAMRLRIAAFGIASLRQVETPRGTILIHTWPSSLEVTCPIYAHTLLSTERFVAALAGSKAR